MKQQNVGLIRIVLIFLAVLVVIRFLPLFIRMGQTIFVGVRTFWWVVVPIVIAGLTVWKLKRRSRSDKRSESLLEVHPERDVTKSVD